jgi:hypothetical protein
MFSTFEADLTAAANGLCVSDADCACFFDLFSAMRVSDRASAAKLKAERDAFSKRRCPSACADIAVTQKCSPRCQDGVCR